MKYAIVAITRAEVVDFDDVKLTDPALLKKLNGIACVDDTALNYLEYAEVDDDVNLSGGYLRLQYDEERNQLNLSVEIAANRKLKQRELKSLKENLIGQISDGIGAGAFDDLHRNTDLTVRFPNYARLQIQIQEGKAWIPRPTAGVSIKKKYGPIKRWVEKQDNAPKSKSQSTKRAKPAPNERKVESGSKPTKQVAANFKKLLRLLDKVDRNSMVNEIKAEIQNIGGDLSGLANGQLPYGNFQEPRLLKLLLKADLSPEIVDKDGHHLLWQAAASAKSVRLLLEYNVEVDRRTEDVYKATALMRAASLGRLASVEALLAAGANPKLQDHFGKTATDAAKRSRDPNEKKVIAAMK